MEKDSLIRDLRSVILSCKQGVSVNQLNSDFKAFIGTDIPFRSHGYGSLEDFLKDIPDVIKLKNHNGQLIAEAIADSSTIHLSNLISKQKGSKNKASISSQKVHYKKANSNFKSKAACPTLSNDEKDKIIRDLQSQLNQQKRHTEDYRTQLVRLNSLIKIGQVSLSTEQDLVKKLKLELETLKVSKNCINIKDKLEMKEKQIAELEKGRNSDHLAQEVKDLKSKLEKEKKINKDFTTEIIRLNSLIKIGQDSLLAEQEFVKNLKSRLEALQVSSNSVQTKLNSDKSLLTKEVEALKAELKKEKKMKDELLAEKCCFQNKTKLDTEQELSTLLQGLLDQLLEKLFLDMTLPVSSKRKEYNEKIQTAIGALSTVLNKWSKNEADQSQSTISISNNLKEQVHLHNYFSLYEKQCLETRKLEHILLNLDQKLQSQVQKLQIHDQKLQSQGQMLQNQSKKLKDQEKRMQDLEKIFLQKIQSLTSDVQEFFRNPNNVDNIAKQIGHILTSNGSELPSSSTNTESHLPSTQCNLHSSIEESLLFEGKKKKRKKKRKVVSNSDNPN